MGRSVSCQPVVIQLKTSNSLTRNKFCLFFDLGSHLINIITAFTCLSAVAGFEFLVSGCGAYSGAVVF